MGKYLLNLFVALDQLVNTLLGGDPDMTLSGRMGRAVLEGRCQLCRGVCWLLDLIDSGHCLREAANEADEGANEVVKL